MSRATVPDSEVRAPLLAPGREVEPRHAAQGDDGSGQAASVPNAAFGEGTFARNLGALEAFGIVVSVVIGSGVFTSPGAIDSNVPSPGAALLVWLVGGVLAWTGAATLAELGTAIPSEGGVQPFLQHIYGDAFGFLAAWTWVVAVMPATLAILSIVFVESIYSAAGVTDQAGRPAHKLLSVLVLTVITAANCFGTKASTRLNSFFVVTKFVTILAVVVAGLGVVVAQLVHPDRTDIGGRDWFTRSWFGYRETATPDGHLVDWRDIGQWEMFGHLSAALYGALWGYSGWDKVRTVRLVLLQLHPADIVTGHLHLRRALEPGSPAASGHKHLRPDHYRLFSCCKRGLLHSPSLEPRLGDRRRSGGG